MKRTSAPSALLLPSLLLIAGSVACNSPSEEGAGDMSHDAAMRIPRDYWMPSASVKGRVQDESGGAIADMTPVLACSSETCLTGKLGADGTFLVSGLHLRAIVVKIQENLTLMPRHAEAACATVLTKAEETVDVGMITVPLLGAGVDYTAGSTARTDLVAGDGLTVTFTPKDLLVADSALPRNIAARLVPPEKRCPIVVPDGGAILAVYALSPFAATSKPSKLGFKAAVPAVAGSEVHFWALSDLDGTLGLGAGEAAMPAIGHADQEGKTVATDPGTGLVELSWLVISTKP